VKYHDQHLLSQLTLIEAPATRTTRIRTPMAQLRRQDAVMQKRDITVDVARRLVAAQFPQWADLAILPVAHDGWDNTTFRLGDELSLRLPSHDDYIAQIGKEQRWLPMLAPLLPRRIPEPVATGRPDGTFPRPWSVYRWIDGVIAGRAAVSDLTAFATDLGTFLASLQSIDATDGPAAGAHSFFRGSALGVYDADARQAIDVLGDDIDAGAAARLWHSAIATSWTRPPVWVHGDIAASNLLVDDVGALRAVIDFGCCAVGDPACDLVIAWTFFDGASREAFRTALALDDDTWRRARGWALWKALITMAEAARGGMPVASAAERCGWRLTPAETIDAVLGEER
jgi:aminoglycoside phosphotransferase (APT) family kinase protein